MKKLARETSAPTDESVLNTIRTRLFKLFDIERIVLFGSRARGDQSVDSDWDVLVIAKSTLPFLERQQRALMALRPRNFPVDLLMYTPEEAAIAGAKLGSAVYWAEREGRVFYAK